MYQKGGNKEWADIDLSDPNTRVEIVPGNLHELCLTDTRGREWNMRVPVVGEDQEAAASEVEVWAKAIEKHTAAQLV